MRRRQQRSHRQRDEIGWKAFPAPPDAPPSVLKAPVFPGRGFSFAPPAAADFRNWPLPRPGARSHRLAVTLARRPPGTRIASLMGEDLDHLALAFMI